HEVHVVTYHIGQSIGDAPIYVHRIPRVPGYRRAAPGPTYAKLFVLDPLLYWKVRSVLNGGSFDVIHALLCLGLLVVKAARWRAGAFVVYDAHTLLRSELPYYRMGVGRGVLLRIGASLDQRVTGWADHVVTVTPL